MKKIIGLITGILLSGCLVSFAQPTLTATGTNPVIGDSYTAYNSSYVNPGNSGANQTWDLSAMVSTTSASITFVYPASTANGNSFLNSTIASINASGVAYYKTSSSAFQNYGAATSAAIIPFSDPEDFMRFPFTYTSTFSDTWAAQFTSSSYVFYRTGITTVTADGYGTLITPGGTYTNVMRVHFVQNYQDSAFIGMPYIITYNNDEYMWYKDGIHIQIAAVYTETTSTGGPYTGGIYVAGTSGIDHPNDLISSLDIFPNPANDKVNVHLALTVNQKINIKLFNYLGQQVKADQIADGDQGMSTIQLDVVDLPAGIYSALIILNDKVAGTKSFLISR